MIRQLRTNIVLFALSALHFADAALGAASAPATAVTKASVKGVQPVLDLAKLTPEEKDTMLLKLFGKVNANSNENFSIRFYNGQDSTLEFDDAGKPVLWESGPNKGKQKGSARDGGGIGVYGFGRNPTTLFANQWIDLAARMPAILAVIQERHDEIDSYITKKTGSAKNAINEAALQAAVEMFQPKVAPLVVTDDNVGEVEAALQAYIDSDSQSESDSPEQIPVETLEAEGGIVADDEAATGTNG